MLAVAGLLTVLIAAVAWLLRGVLLDWVERLIAGAVGETVLAPPSVTNREGIMSVVQGL